MNVLHPTLLALGLAAVALPVLIHLLLRRRYRPMAWAAMRFVQVAHRQQRRRRRIEQLLLLIARCLLVAMIALAVAHPVFGSGGTARETTLVLVIDNALASGATGADGASDLDGLREWALAAIGTLSPGSGDRVAVIAGAAPARGVVASPTAALAAARRAVEGLAPADSAFDLAGALGLAEEIVDGSESPTRIAVLSAWRRGSADGTAGSPAGGTGLRGSGATGARRGPGAGVEVVASPPAAGERPNLRLRSLEIPRSTLLRDDTPAARQATVLIDRTGPADDAVRGEVMGVLVRADGTETPGRGAAFEIGPGERETRVSLELPPLGGGAGEDAEQAVALEARLSVPGSVDGVRGDSVARGAVRLAPVVTAGVVRARGVATDDAAIPASAWVRAALRPSERAPVRLRELSPGGIDPTALIGLDLVAVARPDLLTPASWSALGSFADSGGTLVLFAPDIAGSHAWSADGGAHLAALRGLGTEATDLEPAVGLSVGRGASGLTMLRAELAALAGSVRVSRVLPMEADAERVVLGTETGEPVLVRAGDGVWVFTVAASPDWSDLPARPLFVPIMQEVARQAPATRVAQTLTAGRAYESARGMAMLGGDDAGEGLRPGFAPSVAGVRPALDAGGNPVGVVAVNADSDAGDTTPTDRERAGAVLGAALEGVLGDGAFSWTDDDADREDSALAGSPLGSLAFGAAALLALLETLVAMGAARRGGKIAGGSGVPA